MKVCQDGLFQLLKNIYQHSLYNYYLIRNLTGWRCAYPILTSAIPNNFHLIKKRQMVDPMHAINGHRHLDWEPNQRRQTTNNLKLLVISSRNFQNVLSKWCKLLTANVESCPQRHNTNYVGGSDARKQSQAMMQTDSLMRSDVRHVKGGSRDIHYAHINRLNRNIFAVSLSSNKIGLEWKKKRSQWCKFYAKYMHPTSKAVVTETPTITTRQRKLHISLPTLNPTAETSNQTEKVYTN